MRRRRFKHTARTKQKISRSLKKTYATGVDRFGNKIKGRKSIKKRRALAFCKKPHVKAESNPKFKDLEPIRPKKNRRQAKYLKSG